MLLHYKINMYSVQSELRQPEVTAIVTAPALIELSSDQQQVAMGRPALELALGCTGKDLFGVSMQQVALGRFDSALAVGCTGTTLGQDQGQTSDQTLQLHENHLSTSDVLRRKTNRIKYNSADGLGGNILDL